MATVGGLLVTMGVLVLYLAWRRSRRHRGLVLLGWGLIACAYLCWSRAAGADSGPAAGTVVLMLGALVLVLAFGQWRTKRSARTKQRSDAAISIREDNGLAERQERVGRIVLRVLAAGPLALTAALSVAMMIVARAPGVEADRLVTAAFAALLLWAAGMIWSCAARRPAVPTVALTVLSVASVAFLPVFNG